MVEVFAQVICYFPSLVFPPIYIPSSLALLGTNTVFFYIYSLLLLPHVDFVAVDMVTSRRLSISIVLVAMFVNLHDAENNNNGNDGIFDILQNSVDLAQGRATMV